MPAFYAPAKCLNNPNSPLASIQGRAQFRTVTSGRSPTLRHQDQLASRHHRVWIPLSEPPTQYMALRAGLHQQCMAYKTERMDKGINELQGVVESMRQPLRGFAATLRRVEGDNALSLVLFGGVLAPEFDAQFETARSVLVVHKINLDALAQLAEQGVKFGREAIAAPLIMTPTYIKDSLDTFPIELLDITRRHVVVFGEDHFASLAVNETDLRRQCERELKGVLVGLRQGLLAATGKEKWLNAIEVDVARGLLRVLRSVLWLKGQKDWPDTNRLLAAVETITGRSLSGLRGALDRNGVHGWDEFKSLYGDVEALAALVEKL